MTETIHLCVMSDDLGMHPAINDGIALAFSEGLLTDANIMAPCPAFRAGAEIARQTGLPVGFHATLTCDWDRYHWGPLTAAPTLRTPEGYFPHLVSLTWAQASDEDVAVELEAQLAAIEAEGIRPTHSCYHMGHDDQGRFFRIVKALGVERAGPMRLEYPGEPVGMPHHAWDTVFCSSDWTPVVAERKARLMEKLAALGPGYHLWTVHAAVDHPSLDELCSPDFFARPWARAYRAADMALLMDPEIKDFLAARGVERISTSAAPVAQG